MRSSYLAFLVLALWISAIPSRAQEAPYFVTYDHQLEEPRNLEIETQITTGIPRSGQNTFFSPYMELEYGTTAWWTTEFYLEGQGTSGDSGLFTGWRLENRFRPLAREHWINPVLYFEYENINEASRILKEIVGNSPELNEPNDELREHHAHELEAKLILSSTVHDWNISENFIVEKNLSESEGFEFGYALGVSRPLSRIASSKSCRFCRENFVAGFEMYGGLGSTLGVGLHDTTHYLAPVISWQVSDNSSIRFSAGAGLTDTSNPVILRVGYSYEIRGFGNKVARLLGGK